MRFILASASPQRASLLREAGFDFVVHPSSLDEESFFHDLLPSNLAQALALAKAEAVAPSVDPDDVILAADTIVAFGDAALGKPADADHARVMLTLLSGSTHLVITGVAVIRRSLNYQKCARVISAVSMKRLTDAQIEAYVASNAWQGKAGGYGLQDPDPFVRSLTGCPTNVVGLPMTTTRQLLAEAGILPGKPKSGPAGQPLS